MESWQSFRKFMATTFKPKPVVIDTDRAAVELVWQANMFKKDVGFKDLMLLSYRRGKVIGAAEELEALAKRMGLPPIERPAELNQIESIYDRDPKPRDTYAGWVADPVTADQRAMARESRR